MKEIRSADNPRFKALLKLVQSSRERKRAGLSVLDGAHLVAAYSEHVGSPEDVIVSTAGSGDPAIRGVLAGLPQPLVLADPLFARLSSVVTPTGIIAIVKTPRAEGEPPRNGPCVMIEDVQDPGNLGSMLRTAAAAAMPRVLISTTSVQAWSPRVLRAAMGAHFMLRIHEGVDVVAAARAYEGRVIAAKQGAPRTVFQEDLRGDAALAFGNEGSGLSPELLAAAHAVVAIPMPGKTESLNVAAAAAVVLFERVRQMAARE